MRAVVTGATGFLGSRLTRRLIDEGHDVAVLARPTSTFRELAGYIDRLDVHMVDETAESIRRALAASSPAVVFHLATYYVRDHRPEDLGLLLESNVAFPLRLVDAMTREGIRNLVNAGSAWQYYEGDTYRPVCLHSATKQAFESLARYFIDAGKIRCTTLMVHDTYGPHDPRRKIFSILRDRAVTSEPLEMSAGEQLIDLVHVEDVVSAFLVAAERLVSDLAAPYETYSVTGGDPQPLRAIVETYLRLSGNTARVLWGARPYHEREVMVPWRGGKPLPGWHPQVALEDGLRGLLESQNAAQVRPGAIRDREAT